MKKFFWFLLLIFLLPLMPFPVIAFIVIYYFIKKKQGLNFNEESLVNWQKSFSTSWSWPPKNEPHTPQASTIHYHRPHMKHHHKTTHTSDQEIRLRLGIILIGIVLISLLFILR